MHASLGGRVALFLTLAACGACARRSEPATASSLPAPRALVACPADEDASASPVERRVRESLGAFCVPGPGGRWELALSELAVGALDEEEEGGVGERLTGRFALVFVDGAGARIASTQRPFELRQAEDWWSADAVEARAHFDLDGDGLEELFVWLGHHEYEGTPVGELVVLTVRAGAVVPYAPARVGVAIDEVEDVDADGRPDLVARAPYAGTSPWGASPVPAGGPANVFRSLPDGSFSNTDPVALARVRASCPALPTRYLGAHPSEEAYEAGLTAVSCARIRGLSTDEIVRAVRREEAAGACTDEHTYDCASLVAELVRHASLVPAHDLR